MDAISVNNPSWSPWITLKLVPENQDGDLDSGAVSDTEITCIDLTKLGKDIRSSSAHDVTCQKLDAPSPDQHHQSSWDMSMSSTSISQCPSLESVSKLREPASMTKSLADMTAACSNTSLWSSSYVRRCSSTTSLPSLFLDQMIVNLAEKGIRLPNKDRKILELMVARHQDYLEKRDNSNVSHRIWEQERVCNVQRHNDEEKNRRQYILRKLQAERRLRDTHKLEESKKERATVLEIERTLQLKEEKWKERWDIQEAIRKDALLKMKMRENDFKLAQERLLMKLEKDKQLDKEMLALESECRLVRSVQSRQNQEMESLMALKRVNSASERRHALRMKEVSAQFREKLHLLQEEIEFKDAQSAKNMQAALQEREMKLKHESQKRASHAKKVREVLNHLEEDTNLWLKETLLKQQFDLQEGEERAQKFLENRSASARKQRLQRMIKHNRRMQGIHNEQTRQLILATHNIASKERRIQNVALAKDQKLQESRKIALASSELRQQLKWILQQDVLGRKLSLPDLRSQVGSALPL